jgi:hypothetical protein
MYSLCCMFPHSNIFHPIFLTQSPLTLAYVCWLIERQHINFVYKSMVLQHINIKPTNLVHIIPRTHQVYSYGFKY